MLIRVSHSGSVVPASVGKEPQLEESRFDRRYLSTATKTDDIHLAVLKRSDHNTRSAFHTCTYLIVLTLPM